MSSTNSLLATVCNKGGKRFPLEIKSIAAKDKQFLLENGIQLSMTVLNSDEEIGIYCHYTFNSETSPNLYVRIVNTEKQKCRAIFAAIVSDLRKIKEVATNGK